MFPRRDHRLASGLLVGDLGIRVIVLILLYFTDAPFDCVFTGLFYSTPQYTSVGAQPATIVSLGWAHSVVSRQISAKVFGYGAFGQVDTAGTDVTSSTGVAGVMSAFSYAGANHTCLLFTAPSGIACFGLNSNGQLGTGSTTNLMAAPSIPTLANVASGSAGGAHTCAVMSATGAWLCICVKYYSSVNFGCISSGAVRCWGLGTSGQVLPEYIPLTFPRLP